MKRIKMQLELNTAERIIVIDPRITLLDALRDTCGLRGATAGCADGVCGSCTVLVDGEPVRACLMFAVQAHGKSVRTVEGLADGDALSTLQEAFLQEGAAACGFCTAGFLMLAEGALALDPDMDEAGIAQLVASNLCRCGSYAAIRDAIAAARTKEAAADQ